MGIIDTWRQFGADRIVYILLFIPRYPRHFWRRHDFMIYTTREDNIMVTRLQRKGSLGIRMIWMNGGGFCPAHSITLISISPSHFVVVFLLFWNLHRYLHSASICFTLGRCLSMILHLLREDWFWFMFDFCMQRFLDLVGKGEGGLLYLLYPWCL